MKTFELILSNEETQGVNCIGVVENPAFKESFIALSSQEKKIVFKEVDKKQLILMGIILKPNKEIYRFDEETKTEYNVFFSPETVKRISQLYFKNNAHKNFNLDHNSKNTLQGYLTENWIVEDSQKDKSALYELGAEVGDWVGVMKFESEEEYNRALETGTGFSIEGIFEEKLTIKNENMDFKQMKTELFAEMKALFGKEVKLAQVMTADGSITLEFDGDVPVAGMPIMQVTTDGSVPAPIGDYELQDGTTISVAELGVIGEISTVAEETSQTEEMSQPSLNDVSDLKQAISSMLIKFQEENNKKFSELEAKFSEAKKETENLKVELSETPAVEKTKVAPIEKIETTNAFQKFRAHNNKFKK